MEKRQQLLIIMFCETIVIKEARGLRLVWSYHTRPAAQTFKLPSTFTLKKLSSFLPAFKSTENIV
jgi:hypothetical protein